MINDIYNGDSEGFSYLVDGYMDYSQEVIARRAIPDLRDGLKPVQRRIIYASKLADKKQMQKCGTLIGEIMKYHPHGDSSIWGSFVLMAANNGSWNMPVFKGMGNLGKVYSSNPPAAYRYPKAMLHENAEEYFKEKKVMEMVQSEEGDGLEPVVLYPSYPTVLVNGTAGIAVSVGTRIPSFNFGDVLDLTMKYIRDGSLDPVKDIIYPDFPTGGVLVKTDSEVAKIMATGRGKLKIRANVEINGNEIIVTEVPFGKTIESIIKAIESSEIREIKTVINETGNGNSGRICIVCRSRRVVDWVLLELYRRGILQTTFASNMLVINEGKPYILGVHGVIEEWVKFRRKVIVKKFAEEIKGIEEELTSLDYFIRLVKNREWRDKYVALATMLSRKDADEYLHEIFPDIPKDVCDWINGRAISAFNNGGRYVNRYNDLTDYNKYCSEMKASPDTYILKELQDLKKTKKGSYDRKTYISNVDYRFTRVVEKEDSVDDSPCVYTLTKDGFLLKTRDIPERNDILCQFKGYANSPLIGFDKFGRILRLSGTEVGYTAVGANGLYLPKVYGAIAAEDYRILYFCVCDGTKKMLVYRDGYIGFLDTSEWVGKKIVKVTTKGVCLAVMDKLLHIYEEKDIPECIALAEDNGTTVRLGIVNTETIPERGRTSRAKVFNSKNINTAYIKGMTYLESYMYVNSPNEYTGKLNVVDDETFIGDPSEMEDGFYLDICKDLEEVSD